MSTATTSRLAESAAPLDVLLVDAALGPAAPLPPRPVDGEVGGLSRAQPEAPPRGGWASWAPRPGRILTGASTLAPDRGDRRFTDVAWTENPLLKRLVQLYLAGGHTVEQLSIDADLGPRDRAARAVLPRERQPRRSPEQRPAGQPGLGQGRDRHRGAEPGARGQQLVKDLASAPRVPEMVDAAASSWATTSPRRRGAVVFRTEVLELIQYAPPDRRGLRGADARGPAHDQQVLRDRPRPGRSLVEFGVRQGRQMFVISWRNPDSAARRLEPRHLRRRLLDALEAVEEITGSEQTVLGGVCSGGILAGMTAAYLAGIGRAGPAGRALPAR